jgi:hypothetical protein
LRKVQEKLSDLERFPLFLAMLDMDLFMLKKARPEAPTAGSVSERIRLPESNIDPLWKRSDTHLVSLSGESLERMIPPNSVIAKQKWWFKKTTGLRRRGLYLVYLQSLILLNLIEIFVYGYSTRDGGDFAIKLTVLGTELQSLLEPDIGDYFAFCISLSEIQLRKFDRPDGMTPLTIIMILIYVDLNWLLAIKQLTPVQTGDRLPNWELIDDDLEIVRRLLLRSQYWFTFEVNRLKY